MKVGELSSSFWVSIDDQAYLDKGVDPAGGDKANPVVIHIDEGLESLGEAHSEHDGCGEQQGGETWEERQEGESEEVRSAPCEYAAAESIYHSSCSQV